LLLMAPVIAIGSTALVAGSAGTAGAAAKKASPTITICAAVPGAFRFAVNGVPVSFKAQCGVVKAKIGVNHVTEIAAPALYRTIASISVSPAAARVSSSLRTATANLKLAANQAATVRFVNSKLVVQVPTLPTTPPSSPPVVNPPVGNAPPASPPPSSPPVSNPDPVSLPAGSGYIEVCKSATDLWVQGSFPFTITQGTTSFGTYSVAVGSCTGAIPVPAGTVTVAEGAEGPGYALVSVTSAPVGTLGTVNLGTQTANFTVNAGYETTATFVNATQLNLIKVCKVLANDQGSLAGSIFTFNVSWTFSPATGAKAISNSGPVNVVAVPSTVLGGACTLVTNWPLGIPVGSKVWVTENAFPNVLLSGVSITPVTFDAGTTATEAVLTVPPAADGYADASFTNEPMGYVEVCKNFYPSYYDATNTATFLVNGGTSVTIQGGTCSAPIQVPAGTATVSEGAVANFLLYSVSTESTSDPFGVRLLTGGGPTNTVNYSAVPVNPASVTVPYGGVGNETVVTFGNVVDGTQFKICKQETSSDANLAGSTFNFTWSYGSRSGTDALTIGSVAPGLVCSDLDLGPYVVNTLGIGIPITITELSTAIPAVEATSITYQGNGSVVSTTTLPVLVTGGTAGITITPGAGINVVTFTNGRTPGYTPTVG
jgi:hypothetical protein